MSKQVGKAIFSASVTKKLNNKMSEEIRKSVLGNSAMKKEIQKVFQQANRRAQNIEKSGVASPAYQALVLEGRTGYSKFSISGINISTEYGWQQAKYEYAKAIEYLNNPTSSATGARQYIKYLANKNKYPVENVNKAVQKLLSTDFINNGTIPFMSFYSNIKDNFMKDSENENNAMNKSANELANEMEKNLNDYIKQTVDDVHKGTDILANELKNAFKFK